MFHMLQKHLKINKIFQPKLVGYFDNKGKDTTYLKFFSLEICLNRKEFCFFLDSAQSRRALRHDIAYT